jgi:hypothetical protein
VVLQLEAGTLLVADAFPASDRRARLVGTPAAQRPMIFQHFTQADSSTPL